MLLPLLLRAGPLRRRLLYTVSLLLIYRLLAHIPLPHVDREALRAFFDQNEALSVFSLFTGGGFRQFSLVLLGVGPYITSSIIFQLLASVIPRLERLQKEEGEYGRMKLSQYTRVFSVPVSLIQGFGFLSLLRSQGVFPQLTLVELCLLLLVIAAASVLLMWLGELITEYGIGNGTSLIITLGIIAGFPEPIAQLISLISIGQTDLIPRIIGVSVVTLLLLAVVVLMTEARRNLPVIYARRSRSLQFSYGQVRTELPLLLNVGGVLPIIFALSVVSVPPLIASLLTSARFTELKVISSWIVTHFTPDSAWYSGIYFILVVFFSFFYALVIVNPKQIAEQLAKQGAYIAGVRPGEETIAFIRIVLIRLTTFGSLFLGLIAVLPFIVQRVSGVSFLIIGGTGLLIVVSVVIETMRVIAAQLISLEYQR